MDTCQTFTAASSWGEYIRAVEKEKRDVSSYPKGEPVIRANCRERKLRERDFNPVTSQFMDHRREENFQTTRDSLNQTKSSSIQSVRDKKFNIIAHTGSDQASRVLSTNRKEMLYSRPYHILSNMETKTHQTIPLNANDETLDHSHPAPIAQKSRVVQREFNLINNEFKHNHQDIMTSQYERTKDHVLKKYWQTHDYDCIRGKFYNPEKEREFRENRQEVSRSHGNSQLSRLPPCVKKSEGQSYNILNCNIKNHDVIKEVDAHDIRAKNRVQKGQLVEANVCQQANATATIHDLRKINRISYNRWQSELERGYNIITTDKKPTPYTGSSDVSGKCSLPQVEKQLSDWDKMTMTSSIDINSSSKSLLSTGPVSNNSKDMTGYHKAPRNLVASPIQTNLPYNNRDLSKTINTSRSVPSLDLSMAESARPVMYKEPLNGTPASQLVSIVPTPVNAKLTIKTLA